MLSRLLYVSRCALRQTGADREAHVRAMAAEAASRNAAAQLTGCLLHLDDTFVQVLEGSMVEVERIFEKICCDFRHTEVKLIDLAPTSERIFADWSLGLLQDPGRSASALRDQLEDVRFLAGINASEAIDQMRRLLELQPA